MDFPLDLIRSYKAGKITRSEFCRRYAAMQGHNDSVTGYSNDDGVFLGYRGRYAQTDGHLISWVENYQQYTARTIKEFKIKIDILEIKAAA